MIDSLAVHPETLRIVQTVHDTVHDTVVRVAAPLQHQPPTWLLTTITATVAVVAGLMAQWFRAVLDDNRERERVRQVLMIDIASMRVYLRDLGTRAEHRRLPSGTHFWHQMDNAMRGYDELRTRLTLLPALLRIDVNAWFLSAKESRLLGEALAETYPKDPNGEAAQLRALVDAVGRLYEWSDTIGQEVSDAIPKRWYQRIGAGITQKRRAIGVKAATK